MDEKAGINGLPSGSEGGRSARFQGQNYAVGGASKVYHSRVPALANARESGEAPGRFIAPSFWGLIWLKFPFAPSVNEGSETVVAV